MKTEYHPGILPQYSTYKVWYARRIFFTNLDSVKLDTDSKFAEYRENLSAVVEEYQAKMLLAQSDDEFEAAYKEFHEQLESRAHWSELKEEWEAAYQAQFGEA